MNDKSMKAANAIMDTVHEHLKDLQGQDYVDAIEETYGQLHQLAEGVRIDLEMGKFDTE